MYCAVPCAWQLLWEVLTTLCSIVSLCLCLLVSFILGKRKYYWFRFDTEATVLCGSFLTKEINAKYCRNLRTNIISFILAAVIIIAVIMMINSSKYQQQYNSYSSSTNNCTTALHLSRIQPFKSIFISVILLLPNNLVKCPGRTFVII